MDEGTSSIKMDSRKLHPFFIAPKPLPKSDLDVVMPATPDPSCSPGSDPSMDSTDSHGPGSERKRKRRKTESSADTKQNTMTEPRSKRRVQEPTDLNDTKPSEQGASKLAGGEEQQQQHQQPVLDANSCHDPPFPLDPALAPSANTDSILKDKDETNLPIPTSKPQKLLIFNPKTGTIGSPPKPKSTPPPTADPAPSKPAARRGRKPKPRIASVSYCGSDDESRKRIGQQIESILLGLTRHAYEAPVPVTNAPPLGQDSAKTAVNGGAGKKEVATNTMTPKKPTHPFFQGKSKTGSSGTEDKPKEEARKRQTIFTSTPCSPKRSRAAPSKFNIPHIGMKSGVLKVPGAQYPAWPWQGITHVRGDMPSVQGGSDQMGLGILSKRRKAKGQEIRLSEEESIMRRVTVHLNIPQITEELRTANMQDFQPPAPVVRIPTRHFESGKKLQERISGELRTWCCTNSEKTHPAITHAYESVQTALSAFDRATCETIAWAQKHAPSSADRVLQSGREADLLRDWLQTLKVQAVDTGLPDGTSKPKVTAPAKKRRKRKKLEGFVVSSDEEANEMDEISESELDWQPNGNQARTVLRSGDPSRNSRDPKRLTNAVVLSGPHGCGKTATVYAIAKELDFEIFEINPGARRNGRDILEKVGDMTRNHLVQHQRKEGIREETPVDDEVSRDLKSGKQGMMTAFLKPKPAKPDRITTKPEPPSTTESCNSKESKKPSKNQKQSLILLEEVDILYEEDKQFWTTIISMISQSKRPFIMTCNDESLVPLQNLSLYGIFRFSSPPKDLAVDLLLLIAANEGHALRRHPVEALYDSRGHDLRASITELNYWCQIGVGDMRGGFDWFYPRWPKGSDVDKEGNTIRVVSQDTYHAGMGWLNRDSAVTESVLRSVEEELHDQTWDFWGFDVFDPSQSQDFSSWATKSSNAECSAEDRLALLASVDAFSDLMSDCDLFGAHISPASYQISMDATNPSIPAKSRDDYIIGRPLLEVTPLGHFHSTSLDLSSTLRNLAQKRLQANHPVYENTFPFPILDESRAIDKIKNCLTDSLKAEPGVTRPDYSIAFDPIAVSEKVIAGGYLDPSVFDRTMTMIALDIAPYVRSIVAYDQRLQQERRSRSTLLSEGAQPGKKRMRTTRSAYSALEGGSRASTRRERYFAADINPYLVLRTGGKGWAELVNQAVEEQNAASSKEQSPDPDPAMDSSPGVE
ncbi:hypothetical protein F4809DRAFT_175100 [Biscogniauxia mediterranea]|nr:hypothetical protein F4809DRAFT_175100 [Biscogniauxia mediterranea]